MNLYEKVQIPEYQEAILKISRFLEDEENLAKASQKILKAKAFTGGDGGMIVKMKKISLLLYHQEKEQFLGALQDAGFVHIVEDEHKDTGSLRS